MISYLVQFKDVKTENKKKKEYDIRSTDWCRTQNEISIIHSCYIPGIMLRFGANKMKKKMDVFFTNSKVRNKKKNGRNHRCL